MATDSYRLAMRDIDGVATRSPTRPEILVPARALAELQTSPVGPRRPKDADGRNAGSPRGRHRDHDVTFSAGNVKVSTRLLDGRYPDYRQLIPADYPNRLHVGKDSLLDALRRVRLLVRDNTTPVRLSMRQGGVDLTVVSQEVGDASETVDADFDGTDLTIAFNPTYLIDGVEAVPGDEVVARDGRRDQAGHRTGAEDDNFRYLLMPVRVS